ncbi:hypothetical protein GCM10010466_07050 [Planomonospora alba]|uniref:Lipoprotein n=1 Tax=Planomonospora alba TaxID=161354 RepID=A0ABP6MLK9_9ACTN
MRARTDAGSCSLRRCLSYAVFSMLIGSCRALSFHSQAPPASEGEPLSRTLFGSACTRIAARRDAARRAAAEAVKDAAVVMTGEPVEQRGGAAVRLPPCRL